MPKIPHTLRRNQTYYLRVRIPSDVVSAYDGKKDIVRSLKTSDAAEARTRVDVAFPIQFCSLKKSHQAYVPKPFHYCKFSYENFPIRVKACGMLVMIPRAPLPSFQYFQV